MQQKEQLLEGNNLGSTSKHSRQQIWVPLIHHHHHDVCRSSLMTFFLIVICFGAYASTRLFFSSVIAGNVCSESKSNGLIFNNQLGNSEKISKKRDKIVIPLNCSLGNNTNACPANYYPKNDHNFSGSDRPGKCPEYFRWIHEDLSPWRETGITEKMVTDANKTANFRLIISNGKAYVETYERSFQSRDTFTLWGILQLLRRYPGRLPDLDLMFDCGDWPVIGKYGSIPPALFRYCGHAWTHDIVFPDWSFWGWPEINVKPWKHFLPDLKDGNEITKWEDRDPYAFWKGNPVMGLKRKELLKCNVSDQHDWNARVFAQNWYLEKEQGYKQSDMSRQCNHRYKIYIEGQSWSVSEKYILGCNSVALLVKPFYHDFFTRGLMPLQHYWPIKDDDDMCKSIKHAVDWGNSHPQEAQAIGNAGSRFIQEELKMEYVYDYMFHLLSEYAKLLTYKPIVPLGAIELCSESMECPEKDTLFKKFMMGSLVNGLNDESPCEMPPPYDPATLASVRRRTNSAMKKVETWENEFWDSQNKQG